MTNLSRIAVAIVCLLAPALAAVAQSSTVTIEAGQPGVIIGSNLFGIFFEEINSAGDGGIYAELIRNRSFEDATNALPHWSVVTTGTASGQLTNDSSLPLSTANPRCLKLTMSAGVGTVGAANNGYWGIPVQAGSTCELGLYARCAPGFSGAATVSLESTNGGAAYAQSALPALTAAWQHFTLSLVPNATDPAARLVLRIAQTGTVYFDFVSLFPAETFNQRTNGLRPDLVGMLADLRPSFVRFPGGSWVDGISLEHAYHWPLTVGDPANRTERTNVWGYMVSNGLGYHEYLQMCEDLGALPLLNVNAGMDVHQNAIPPAELGPWVQEALDAIEYANGDTNTPWGALRAANGHPQPFDLRYIEIGNENGGADYAANYALFYDAIKSNYPGIRVIANSWGGIPTTRPVELMDEHYYRSAAWFVQNAALYDGYSRTGPKVFVGEYATGYGISFPANLQNALGEAAWMTGLERNADIVELACYAPLFCNLNNVNWNPNLIYFNGTQVYGTPSYYAQRMFSRNRGDFVLPTSVTGGANSAGARGAIGLGSWNTSVQFTNVVVTSNGVVLYQSDFRSGSSEWDVYKGNWSTSSGLYRQTSITTDCRATTGNTNWAGYTLSLRARKISGSEGFLILFNWLDDNNWTWWNIGGWNNTLSGLEQMSDGSKSIISSQVSQTIATNRWYNIQVVLNGLRIQCYLDGELIHDLAYPGGLIASSSYARTNDEIIVKAVNPYALPVLAAFNIRGVNSIAPNATLQQLTSASPLDQNSLAAPTNVSPVTTAITNAGTNFVLAVPAYSLSILRLETGGLVTFTNLELEAGSPIHAGESTPAIVWGWASGIPVNLTTNRAIRFASSSTNVAIVDPSGNIAGMGAGIAEIIASYDSLGLAATQSVRVLAPVNTLAHRYRFNDAPGSGSAADAVGGAAWNGTLPNGGTFADDRLSLAAGSEQYVQLPAGILSDYTAVTVELWATFPTQLPVNCFLYGFGDTDGSGAGAKYIFCAPRAGRIAITGSDPGWQGEQNATGGGDFSFRTNLHVVAVFNPPGGYLALYTDGTLAGINNAITIPLSSVTDVLNYIGRSLYTADPYADIVLNEFRIYAGALAPDEIAATQALGPEELLTRTATLSAAFSGGDILLSWPLAAAGFSLESTSDLAAPVWTPVAASPHIVGGRWETLVELSSSAKFFRLVR